jgi:hypothetical protein
LTKLKYSDLGSIYLDMGYKFIQKAFEVEDGLMPNDKDYVRTKSLNKLHRTKFDRNKISEGIFILTLDLIKPARMFICVLNLMKIKAIEKFQEELIMNSNICFYCDFISKKKDNNFEGNKYYPCLKCNRAYYCSIKCMRKNKIMHDPVCFKYSERFNEINEIVDAYIK